MTAGRVLVLDEAGAARDLVIPALADLGVSVEVTSDLLDLAPHLEVEPGCDALVALVSTEIDTTLRALAVVHESFPALPIVLALDDPSTLKDVSSDRLKLIVRGGVSELVTDLSSRAEVTAALERAVSLGERAREWAAQVAVGTSPTLGSLHVVTSTGGGCGRTFVATNVAAILAGASESVCLIDLDLPVGGVALALHLHPRFTVADALKSGPDELSDDLALLCETSEHGFSVLAAPAEDSLHAVPASEVRRLVDAARRAFDHVVVDAPPSPSPMMLAALEVASSVWCVETPDLRNIRSLKLFLDALDSSQTSTDDLHVVLNKYSDGLGITVDDIVEIVGRRPIAVIPMERAVAQSLNEGTVLTASSPSDPAAQRLREAVGAVVGLVSPSPDAPRISSRTSPMGVSRWALAAVGGLVAARVVGWI